MNLCAPVPEVIVACQHPGREGLQQQALLHLRSTALVLEHVVSAIDWPRWSFRGVSVTYSFNNQENIKLGQREAVGVICEEIPRHAPVGEASVAR
jgi:hypothetical protein